MAALCTICTKKVYNHNKALCCDLCDEWVHIKCNLLDDKVYRYHQKNQEAPFCCLKCIENSIPFSSLNDNQFNIAVNQGVNYLVETNLQYHSIEMDKKLFEQINKAVSIQSDENEDEDDIETYMDCKYYGIDDFKNKKFKSDKTFSVLHLNIHSIQCHLKELRYILAMLEFEFDFICISESKLVKGIEPKVDITLPGYQPPEGTPTEPSDSLKKEWR